MRTGRRHRVGASLRHEAMGRVSSAIKLVDVAPSQILRCFRTVSYDAPWCRLGPVLEDYVNQSRMLRPPAGCAQSTVAFGSSGTSQRSPRHISSDEPSPQVMKWGGS